MSEIISPTNNFWCLTGDMSASSARSTQSSSSSKVSLTNSNSNTGSTFRNFRHNYIALRVTTGKISSSFSESEPLDYPLCLLVARPLLIIKEQASFQSHRFSKLPLLGMPIFSQSSTSFARWQVFQNKYEPKSYGSLQSCSSTGQTMLARSKSVVVFV